MLELAKRCELATGPDRELDEAIHVAVTTFEPRLGGVGWPSGTLVVPAFPGWMPLPTYTSSIDAALTLLPSALVEWAVYSDGTVEMVLPNQTVSANCKAQPRAICAAALRARAASVDTLPKGQDAEERLDAEQG